MGTQIQMPDGRLRELPNKGTPFIILESTWSDAHPGEHRVKHVLFREGNWYYFTTVQLDPHGLVGRGHKDFYEHLEAGLRFLLAKVKDDRANFSNFKSMKIILPGGISS